MAMNKTQSQDDLTRPGLYSIYDNSINDNDNSIYEELPTNLAKHPSSASDIPHTRRIKLTTRVWKLTSSIIVLGSLGIFFNQIGQHLHDNHILVPELASKPLAIGVTVAHELFARSLGLDLSKWVVYAVEGVFLGSIFPLVDRFVFGKKSQDQATGLDNTTILRAGAAFLGVVFGLRNIEWSSSLQAALAWAMLNPCLWLLLDGTLSGFLTSTLVAFVAAGSVVISDIGMPADWMTNGEFIATVLWLSSFIFFGLIVLGQTGRYLLN